MKLLIIITIVFFLGTNSYAQKYLLLDKTMSIPATLTNEVTIKDEYRNLFAVEKSKAAEFVKSLDQIAKELAQKKIPQSFNFYVGSTRFYGIKIPLKKEERMDVVLTTDFSKHKISMHLCDGGVTNASNLFYIKTWASYIRDNMKRLKIN